VSLLGTAAWLLHNRTTSQLLGCPDSYRSPSLSDQLLARNEMATPCTDGITALDGKNPSTRRAFAVALS
jgi:hypothetical protein